jgi:dihydrolipoamide dehydrogenase
MMMVIGGGPAGRIAAMELAQGCHEGEEVILVEKRDAGLGGQCLHAGCMVVCALNDVARHLAQARMFYEDGVVTNPISISYPHVLDGLYAVQKKLASIMHTETTSTGVKLLFGEATVSGRTVTVNGEVYTPDALLIATGSSPFVPAIPGNELHGIYTAHTLLSKRELPINLVIIGGGVVAVEFAYIFAQFGVNVSIIARSTLLREYPSYVVAGVRADLDGILILEETTVLACVETEPGSGMVGSVTIKSDGEEQSIPADMVLFATGTRPNADMIEGISKNSSGEIVVNEHMETSVQGVYAAGDVCGPPHLTPYARYEGRAAASAMLGKPIPKPQKIVPQAIKLHYEHGWCQSYDADARYAAMPSLVGSGSFWKIGHTSTGKSILSSKEDGAIVSMYESSPVGSLTAAYMGYLIENGITTQELASMLEVHPSPDGMHWLAKYFVSQR